ncbi:hypothetical protein [Streptomyces sp. NPDC096132]|uniref:hypothetical protein n=1 Tax=Streptomyces sp. NPDC096132 TaxID=3366075 RepID=UPI0037FF5241
MFSNSAEPCVPPRSTGPPTEAEREDFLGHFERRKLSVGTCARAYGTACVHEHACFSQLRGEGDS